MLFEVPGLPQACETALQHPLRPAIGPSQEFGTLHVLHAMTSFCTVQPWVPAASGIAPKIVQVTNCWQIQIDSNYMKFAEVQMRLQNSRKWKIRKSVTELRQDSRCSALLCHSLLVPGTSCSMGWVCVIALQKETRSMGSSLSPEWTLQPQALAGGNVWNWLECCVLLK